MASLSSSDVATARKILESHYHKNYQLNSYPEDWRNLSEIPSKEEIMPKKQVGPPSKPQETEKWDDYQREPVYDLNLPVNIINGGWESKMAYVGAHYQLLREDTIAALRRSVGEIQRNPNLMDDNDTCIYTHVAFTGLMLSRNGAAFRVSFNTERASKGIRWEQSKRLLQGTLVALSPSRDSFKSICKLAIIAARPFVGGLDQNPPTVDLYWAEPSEAEFDPVEQWTMVEATQGYFEASRHMLAALQKMMTENTNLLDHVAFVDKNITPPKYLQNQPFLNLTGLEPDSNTTGPASMHTEELFNVDVLENFPTNLRSTMDASQMQACQDMLTKSVAIVQGPPGTGKTFTSVSALKVMIQNLGPDDPPIIISAQTNHALDQLLNHVMNFETRIVRLGGRADKENKSILKRTLYELRQANPDVPRVREGIKRCSNAYTDIVERLKVSLPVLRNEYITAEELLENNLITEKQRQSLIDEERMYGDADDPCLGLISEWVGGALKAIKGTPQVNLGLPMEEEDISFEQARLLALELDGNENDPDSPAKDQDSDALGGVWVPFKRKFTGCEAHVSDVKMKGILKKTSDLNRIEKGPIRGEIYRYWEKKLNIIALRELRAHLTEYHKMVRDYQVTKAICNIRTVSYLGIKVIGCTTTGLAKYRGLISALQPKVLLVEEAAETLEGTIMSGMIESLEQLILIGDHKQLQARCTVRALENKPYYLALSMFERLIGQLPFVMLNMQRRMIPEVRKLLCIEPAPFYQDLYDHSSILDRVNARPPVTGMGGLDTYFFHHQWPEAKGADNSRHNLYEAEMMSGFFHYLVSNGEDASKITVLTFYNGQRKALIKELKRTRKDLYPVDQYFKVFTVDSYQGEENDIILLSLVRSNTSQTVGFLDNKNRLVVALSRARRGLYLFGNTITLTIGEEADEKQGRTPLWDPLVKYMAEHRRYKYDGGLPITCTKHGNTVRITDPESWIVNAGGCEVRCTDLLRCGHPCPLLCHPYDHNRVNCRAPCPKKLPCGHGCSAWCSEKCRCDACSMNQGPDGQMVVVNHFTSADLVYGTDGEAKVSQGYGNTQFVYRDGRSPGEQVDASLIQAGGRGLCKDDVFSETLPTMKHYRSKQPQSTPQTWGNWNAKQADIDSAKHRALQDQMIPVVEPTNRIFEETYVPTTVQNGHRKVENTMKMKSVIRQGGPQSVNPAVSNISVVRQGLSQPANPPATSGIATRAFRRPATTIPVSWSAKNTSNGVDVEKTSNNANLLIDLEGPVSTSGPLVNGSVTEKSSAPVSQVANSRSLLDEPEVFEPSGNLLDRNDFFMYDCQTQGSKKTVKFFDHMSGDSSSIAKFVSNKVEVKSNAQNQHTPAADDLLDLFAEPMEQRREVKSSALPHKHSTPGSSHGNQGGMSQLQATTSDSLVIYGSTFEYSVKKDNVQAKSTSQKQQPRSTHGHQGGMPQLQATTNDLLDFSDDANESVMKTTVTQSSEWGFDDEIMDPFAVANAAANEQLSGPNSERIADTQVDMLVSDWGFDDDE